jgi:hypothetical protein
MSLQNKVYLCFAANIVEMFHSVQHDNVFHGLSKYIDVMLNEVKHLYLSSITMIHEEHKGHEGASRLAFETFVPFQIMLSYCTRRSTIALWVVNVDGSGLRRLTKFYGICRWRRLRPTARS